MPLTVKNQVPVGIQFVATNTRQFIKQFENELQRSNISNVKLTTNSRGFAKAEVSMRRLGQATKQTTGFLDDFANKSALAFKRYTAFALATFGFLRFTRGVSNAFEKAVQFERELIKVAQVTDRPLSSLKGLTNQIFELSTALGTSSNALAESARLLSQAGFTASQTQQTLQALAKTDLAPNFKNLKDTTEAAIAILNQFRGEQLNIEDAFDAINKSASRFAFDAQDITAAVKRAGSTFSEAGGEFNEFIALFGAVRQQTRQAPETIATAIRTLIPRLQRKRTSTLLDSLGINIREDVVKDGQLIRDQFIGPLRAFEEISKGLQRIGNIRDPRVFQVVEQLGGVRRIETLIPILTNFSKVQEILNVTKEEGSSLDKQAAIAQQSLQVQINKLTEEFQRLFFTIEQNSALRGLIAQVTQLATALARLANFVGNNDILSSLLVGGLTIGSAKLFGSLGAKTAKRFITARNSGGPIPGRGPNRDDKLVAVTGGEYVLRRKAVDKIGTRALDAMNRSGSIPGFVQGGFVKDGYKLTVGKDGRKYYFDPEGKRVSESSATTNTRGPARASGGILLGGSQSTNRSPIVDASGAPISSTPPPKRPAPTAVGLRGTAAIRQDQEVFGPPKPGVALPFQPNQERKFFSPEEKLQEALRPGFSSKISSSGQRIFQNQQGQITPFDKAINPNSEFGKERLAQIKKNIEAHNKLTDIHKSENAALLQRIKNEIDLSKSRDLTHGLTKEQVVAAARTQALGARGGVPQQLDPNFIGPHLPTDPRSRGRLAAARTGARISQFGRDAGLLASGLGRKAADLTPIPLRNFSRSASGFGQRVNGFGRAAGGFINKGGEAVGKRLAGAGRAIFPATIAAGVTHSVVSGLDDRAANKALEGRSGDAADDIVKGSAVGIAGGAATGALIGSAIPGIGTAVGAVVGAGAVYLTEFEKFNDAINYFGFDVKTTSQKIKEAEEASEQYHKQLDDRRKQELAAKQIAQEAYRINEIVLASKEKEIRALRNITALQTAFGAASASIEPILNRLNTSSVATTDVSGLFGRAGSGQLADSEFGTLDKAIRNTLIRTGPIGNEVGQLAAIEAVANKIIPQVIDRTALTSLQNPGTEDRPFDIESVFVDDLRASLEKELPKGLSGGIDSFISGVSGRIFGSEAQDFDRFRVENRQRTVDLALDDTNLRALDSIFAAQVQKNQDLNEILGQRLKAEENATNAINDSNQIRFGFFKQVADTFGNKDFALKETGKLNNLRLQEILGGVSGTGIRDIRNANVTARGNLENIQGSIVGTATDEQRRAAEKEIETIDRTTRALQELASNTSHLSEIQGKLSRLEEQRTTKRDFAGRFAFGSNEDRRGIAESIIATRQAAATGSLEGLSDTQRGQVGELLSQFENVQSSAFGRKKSGEALTGGELRDRLLGGFVGQTKGLVTPSDEETKLLGRLGKGTEEQALATQLLGTIGNETQKLAQAAIDINKTFADEVKKSLSGSLNANILDPLTKALGNIPSEISGNFNHKVEVIFNGAEALHALLPQIESIALKQAQTELNKFIGQNFPDLPAVGVSAATAPKALGPNKVGD